MSTDLRTTREFPPQPTKPIGDDLPLFRFGLRQLLVFMSLMSLLMAAMATVHALTALLLLLATLVVVFHLFSTALGNQLRWHANRARNDEGPRHRPQSATTQPQSRSPWHKRHSTPLPWLARLVAAAALFGGLLGIVLLSGTIGHRTSSAGIAVGSFSLAVVAGWIAFVGYGFCSVFRHGLSDAMAQERHDHSR